jgi:hypothetical protein
VVQERITELMITGVGGATAEEYVQVENSVGSVNPFAGVSDSVQDPLDVEFDAEGALATEDEPAKDNFAAEGRDAVNSGRDSEFAAEPQASSGAPAVVPPPENAEVTLVGVSGLVHNSLIREKWTLAEVESVRLRPGLDHQAQIDEARRQLKLLRDSPVDVNEAPPKAPPGIGSDIRVGLSEEVHNFLLDKEEWTPAEVMRVRVPLGLDREAQIREAYLQFRKT